MSFQISATSLDAPALQRALADDRAGACVTFEGWVRNRNEGQPVQSLEYEAYVPLATSEGEKILAEARAKFALLGATAVHRVGHLQLGEMAVWVGVTAEHRGAAFDACRYIIDEAKARLPIWKKEHYTTGATAWINCATRGEHAGAQRQPSSEPDSRPSSEAISSQDGHLSVQRLDESDFVRILMRTPRGCGVIAASAYPSHTPSSYEHARFIPSARARVRLCRAFAFALCFCPDSGGRPGRTRPLRYQQERPPRSRGTRGARCGPPHVDSGQQLRRRAAARGAGAALALRGDVAGSRLLCLEHDVGHAPQLQGRGSRFLDQRRDEGADERLRDARYQRHLHVRGGHRGHRHVHGILRRPQWQPGRQLAQSQYRQSRARRRRGQSLLRQFRAERPHADRSAPHRRGRDQPRAQLHRLRPRQRRRHCQHAARHSQPQPQSLARRHARRQLRRLSHQPRPQSYPDQGYARAPRERRFHARGLRAEALRHQHQAAQRHGALPPLPQHHAHRLAFLLSHHRQPAQHHHAARCGHRLDQCRQAHVGSLRPRGKRREDRRRHPPRQLHGDDDADVFRQRQLPRAVDALHRQRRLHRLLGAEPHDEQHQSQHAQRELRHRQFGARPDPRHAAALLQ
ncbi:hypothetical protein FGO68_gene5370 [Halteria grandinella]|uniref:Uncharacterized protein n=1 Tax=Halteria grandinella TaxID=5974 RepID=A0A8J8SY10_HALGN|nr:hypothetical protein FGO68_gene5370 [Halteria grandinella]